MSGHSKWANIKHRKEKVDALKGRLFTKIARELMIAAREGGADPEANFRLRLAIDKAKSVNMPNENIQRAIKRATGAGEDAASYEQVRYEGYGPGGVAIMVDALTDNRNRTAADIRHIFAKNGGNLGESGCVAWMFTPKGVLTLEREAVSLGEEELMLLAVEAGAEDFQSDADGYTVITSPNDFAAVREAFLAKNLPLADAELTMEPNTTLEVTGKEAAQVQRLLEALEEHDDVQEVYTNADFAEEASE